MNKILLVIALGIIAGLYSSIFVSSYAQSTDCYDGRMILHVLQLPDILNCLDGKPSGSGESNTASNLGTSGQGLFAQKVGVDLQFKRLTNGTGITLSSNSTHVRINSTATGGATTLDSLTDVDTTGVVANDIIRFDGSNWVDSKDKGDNRTFSLVGNTFVSITKTNIGTVYTPIYGAGFGDDEALFSLRCANITKFFITFSWDYVGTGSQQVRWVDNANSNNILFESSTFTVDQIATESGEFNKPSWCTDNYKIRWQGKSTTGTDDPIARGYKILAK